MARLKLLRRSPGDDGGVVGFSFLNQLTGRRVLSDSRRGEKVEVCGDSLIHRRACVVQVQRRIWKGYLMIK